MASVGGLETGLGIEDLPLELLAHILSYLNNYSDRKSCSLVCNRWRMCVRHLTTPLPELFWVGGAPDKKPETLLSEDSDSTNQMVVPGQRTAILQPGTKEWTQLTEGLTSWAANVSQVGLTLWRPDSKHEGKVLKPLAKRVKELCLFVVGMNVGEAALVDVGGGLKMLRLRGWGLRGLEAVGRYCVHLQKLDISHTQVVDLSPVGALTFLTELQAVGIRAQTLVGLRGCKRLQKLRVSSMDLESAEGLECLGETLTDVCLANCFSLTDISALGECNRLKVLSLHRCMGLLSIVPLMECTSLKHIDLGECIFVRDASVLGACTSLTHVSVRRCRYMRDVGFLSHLPRLVSADISHMDVADMSGLSSCTVLTSLDASYTDVDSVQPLSECRMLVGLDVSGTGVLDLSPLANCGAMECLALDRCVGVRNISVVRNFPNLRKLALRMTGVTDIGPLAHCPNLEQLVVDGAGLVNVGTLVGNSNLRIVAGGNMG
eukprot:comp41014_c0_seq1/m.47431 comp41014_c0_seq1/g.47431  ORF comp41014_c0_seq1/g.47431 comp41014_c0_seq1/m.47431 type:complete len:489 (-) comp41014_c0_seq1:19-1485(-)